jgi:acyl-CoA-dependent ceramide synthase
MTLWWSIYKNVPDVMAFGCYSGTTGEMLSTNESATDNWSHLLLPFQNIDGPICMSPRVKWIFLIFLLCIQVLSLIWFGMIMRVAVNVLRRGQAADDTRSDDEEEEAPKANGSVGASPKVVSENSGTENGWPSVVISSGATQNHHPVRIRTARGRVSLSDHHERRALLGRIGCDKPS